MASTANANEVTETKHNNKNDTAADADAAAAEATAVGAVEANAADKRGPATLSSADNDKKKNGIGNIGNARENYKFDVRT